MHSLLRIVAWVLGSMSALAPAAPPAPHTPGSASSSVRAATVSPTADLSLWILDAYATPVPGPRVLAQWDDSEIGLLGNGDGQVGIWSIPESTALSITIAEQRKGGGLYLGQSVTYLTSAPGDGLDGSFEILTLTQPRMSPVFVSSGVEKVAPSRLPRFWDLRVLNPDSDKITFWADVGVLVSAPRIDAFADYHAVSLPPHAFRRAVDLHVDAGQHLGVTGLGLRIDCRELAFDLAPSVTVVSIVEAPQPETCVATTVGWHTGEEQAFILLEGGLPAGHTLVLLSDAASGGGGSYQWIGSPPAFGTNPGDYAMRGGLEGQQVASNEADACPAGAALHPRPFGATGVDSDCEPAAPEPSSEESCDVPAASGSSGDGCTSYEGPKACKTKTKFLAGKQCGGAGDYTAKQYRLSWDVELSIGFSAYGVEAEAGSTISGSTTTTVGFEFGEGDGCGECKRLYAHFTLCSKLHIHDEDDWEWRLTFEPEGPFHWPFGLEHIRHPCADSTVETPTCELVSGPSVSAPCPRVCSGG